MKRRPIIRWAEPPHAYAVDPTRGGSRGSQWDGIAAELRANPGRSAVVFAGPRNTVSSFANQIRIGGFTCFTPPGSFAVTRHTVPGTRVVELYAKYVGERVTP
jgi:hypothetical protein